MTDASCDGSLSSSSALCKKGLAGLNSGGMGGSGIFLVGWSNMLSGERESCREPGARSECSWRVDDVDGRLVRQLTAASGTVPRGPCDLLELEACSGFCDEQRGLAGSREESGGIDNKIEGPHSGVSGVSGATQAKCFGWTAAKREPTKESQRFGRRITAARYQFQKLSACLVRRALRN